MVALNGPQANLESLNSGQLDVAYIRGLTSAINSAKSAGYPGYIDVLNAGSAEIVNNREGRPGSDVRVRQAIGYALDTTLIDHPVPESEHRRKAHPRRLQLEVDRRGTACLRRLISSIPR